MKDPTLGMKPLAAPIVTSSVQHQVLFLIKDPPLGMNPLAAPIVTSSFQHQVLLLMKHEGSHTRDEPFGCSK